MTADNSLTKTHITKLRKVYCALKMRQKLNKDCTQLIIGEANQKAFDEAAILIGQAINKLQLAKP